MSDHDALLAAILAYPDEDTPRLVFADYLEENGQAERAEHTGREGFLDFNSREDAVNALSAALVAYGRHAARTRTPEAAHA